MACFIVPAAEAVITTILAQVAKKKETAASATGVEGYGATANPCARIPFSRKLGWLRNLLWGGSALLAFEHLWHGEVTPWFPFLTAAGNPDTASVMLREMATVGVSMAALVTLVWVGMLIATAAMARKTSKTQTAKKQGDNA